MKLRSIIHCSISINTNKATSNSLLCKLQEVTVMALLTLTTSIENMNVYKPEAIPAILFLRRCKHNVLLVS